MSPWKGDPIGDYMLKSVASILFGGALWRLVDTGPPSVEVQIGLVATFFVVLLAGLVCEHILAWRAYERGER